MREAKFRFQKINNFINDFQYEKNKTAEKQISHKLFGTFLVLAKPGDTFESFHCEIPKHQSNNFGSVPK